MKVVILAGVLEPGYQNIQSIPKPMIRILNKPILLHIMKHFASYGFKEFYIAAGYKQNIIKNYFRKKKFGLKIKIIDTGPKNNDRRKN